MTTRYQHRVTLACPESLIPQANQLALIVGESAGDDRTFNTGSYQDSQGSLYAVASTVTTRDFLTIPSTGLPESPSYAEHADRAAAQEALDSLTVWALPEDPEEVPAPISGFTMAVDVDPSTAISKWGLTRMETEEP